MNVGKVRTALEKKCVATALIGLGYCNDEAVAEVVAIRMNRPQCSQALADWWLIVEELQSVHFDMTVGISNICLVQ
jgi:hypothetical protein